MRQVPHRILRENGVDVRDLSPDFSFHGGCLEWGARTMPCPTLANIGSQQWRRRSRRKGRNTCLESVTIVVETVAGYWASVFCLRLAWSRQVEFDDDSGLWSGGFWKARGSQSGRRASCLSKHDMVHKLARLGLLT
jgi:hypothetical protein